MEKNKAEIIAQLKKELLPLGGFKEIPPDLQIDTGLDVIKTAFPGNSFPLGATHEFIAENAEAAAASRGFIAAIMGRLMQSGGVAVWIDSAKLVFPPALLSFGIAPDHIIFIDVKREKEVLWVLEESLKCAGLVAVVAELQELTLAASRRLQLAVERSKVTGFILHTKPGKNQTCVTRWRVTPLASDLEEELPGVGFPRWKVVLEKVRNGKPGTWTMEWRKRRFRLITDSTVVHHQEQRKTG